MMIYGEGGTGKSKVIQTISSLFKQKGMAYALQKTSYMGIATSLIDGKTMHNLTGMYVCKRGKMSVEGRR
jgi:hypothetical protein